MKIGNVEQLRDHMIDTLDKLANKRIDKEEAGTTAKLCEVIISSAKQELEYHKILGQKAEIPFLSGAKVVGQLYENEVAIPVLKNPKKLK